MSSNLHLIGLRIENSPMFHVKFDGCEGVMIDKVFISSPKLSPNTDGIHIQNTKSVGIYNSTIGNGIYGDYSFDQLYMFNFYNKCFVFMTYNNCYRG